MQSERSRHRRDRAVARREMVLIASPFLFFISPFSPRLPLCFYCHFAGPGLAPAGADLQ